jgi:hypothetical protein
MDRDISFPLQNTASEGKVTESPMKPSGRNYLNENFRYHLTMDIGKTESSPLVAESELFMIDPHQMQQRSLKIMYMDGILHNIIAKIIGDAMRISRPDSGAGHPHGKTTGVVVTPVIGGRQFAL